MWPQVQTICAILFNHISKCFHELGSIFRIGVIYVRYQQFAGAGRNLNQGDTSGNNVCQSL